MTNKRHLPVAKFLMIIFLIGSSDLALAANDEVEEPKSVFSDIQKTDPSYPAIYYLYSHHIIEGYPDGTFKSDQKVNRAEALKIILLSANYHFDEKIAQNLKNQIPTLDHNFSMADVNPDDWFYPYVIKAYQLKIINGYQDGKFYPEKGINLAETLKMILHAFQAELPLKLHGDPYADIPLYSWFAPYFTVYKNYRLLDEDPTGKIFPDQEITRKSLSELIYRYIKREEFKKKAEEANFIFGKATFYGEGDGFDGKRTATGEIFNKDGFTSASRTLPFGTKIRVYSIENGDFVEVIINDRGPYDDRFILDLSAAAFKKLAPISRGYIPIKFEIIKP